MRRTTVVFRHDQMSVFGYLADFCVLTEARSTSRNHCATTATSLLTRIFFSDTSRSFTLPLFLHHLSRNIDVEINNYYTFRYQLWPVRPKLILRNGSNVLSNIRVFLQIFDLDAISHAFSHPITKPQTCIQNMFQTQYSYSSADAIWCAEPVRFEIHLLNVCEKEHGCWLVPSFTKQ
jgi:hypothetical protein